MEIKLDIIYWVMKTLQSHTLLIQSQIHRLVINFHHRLIEICVSYISMGKSLSHLKVYLMNSIFIKIHGGNTLSRSVYAEGRATKERILKIFAPDLIKSDLWFHILKLITKRNLPQQVILMKV